jgi:hypothetical protein
LPKEEVMKELIHMAVSRGLGLIILLFLCGVCLSCSDRAPGGGKPVAQVNDYVIGSADFSRELSESARFHSIAGLTPSDKRTRLNHRIQRELLIQAAVAQGLDREDHFRESIEKFWEQALITNLLRREAGRLEKEILVTIEEIEEEYRELSAKAPGCPSMDQMMQTIESNVREKKKKKAMDAWVDQLWKNAKITIHEENLESLR